MFTRRREQVVYIFHEQEMLWFKGIVPFKVPRDKIQDQNLGVYRPHPTKMSIAMPHSYPKCEIWSIENIVGLAL